MSGQSLSRQGRGFLSGRWLEAEEAAGLLAEFLAEDELLASRKLLRQIRG